MKCVSKVFLVKLSIGVVYDHLRLTSSQNITLGPEQQ